MCYTSRMATKRLFIAIAFPEEVRAYLTARIDALRQCASRGSFTRAENLHLTLVFLGDTDSMDDVKKVMEETDGTPLYLTLSRAGKFAHDRGDIYWVGVKENPALLSLQARLENSLLAAGFPIEERPYRPHITLGRGVKSENFNNKVSELSFLVTQYVLMESCNMNGRLVYNELRSRSLTRSEEK